MTWILPLIAAPLVASLLSVLIRELPESGSLAPVQGDCAHSAHTLRVLGLVGRALVLRENGRNVKGAASFYLGVQLATFGVAAASAAATSDPVRLWTSCALGWMLLALAWIDVEHMLLPDPLTLPLALLGLAATWLLDPESLTEHALGAVAGYGAFAAIGMLYRKLRGREGLGLGDAKLLAAAGAWLGWAALPMLVVFAALAALATALLALVAKRTLDRDAAMPFGPFLAAGLWLMWLCRAT